jgi:putative transcriptional regulator
MSVGFRGVLRFWVLLLGCACVLAAQSRNPEDLAPGKLLVASHDLTDPLFAKSVILLVQYDGKGAFGLMLNRQTKMTVSRILEEDSAAARDSNPIFVGGPVSLGTVFGLARAKSKPEGAVSVSGDIFFISTKTALDGVLTHAPTPATLRLYAGYCGWDPGQLDGEVLRGSWYIFSRSEDLAFDAKPETLWARLIREADHGDLLKAALVSRAPAHSVGK